MDPFQSLRLEIRPRVMRPRPGRCQREHERKSRPIMAIVIGDWRNNVVRTGAAQPRLALNGFAEFNPSAPRTARAPPGTVASHIWRPGRPAADQPGSPTAPYAGGS